MKVWTNQIFFILALSIGLMGSCVQAPEKPKDKTNSQKAKVDPDVTTSESGTKLIEGILPANLYQDRSFTFTPSVENGSSVSAKNLPSWASFNSVTGEIVGTPTDSGAYDDILLTATRGIYYSYLGPFTFFVRGDPIKNYQWYIKNDGMTSLSTQPPESGWDLNMTNTLDESNFGLGVTIMVSDETLQTSHEDLAINEYIGYSRDYTDGSAIVYGDPVTFRTGDYHGTAAAGIIAARGWNDLGIRGIAPEALVAGNNFLSWGSRSSNAGFYNTILLDQATGNYDIFNYSYFWTDYFSYEAWNSSYHDQVKSGFTSGRSGKGSVYVKAAGDYYKICDDETDDFLDQDGLCLTYNANTDQQSTYPYMIVVGGVNSNGVKSSFSSPGSNIWVSGFGGEDNTTYPGIMTLDTESCTSGTSRNNITQVNDFDFSLDSENSNCNYFSSFHGTGAAAAMVSGAVALMLNANSDLTSREIKHILAVTARKIDLTDTTKPHISEGELSGHTYEQGWVTNAAGYSFHNYYGFGLIDIDAAVSMAKTYSSGWGSLTETNPDWDQAAFKTTVSTSIPDKSATGVTSNLFVSTSLTIESIQVQVNITHSRVGDVGIELTSPSGTKSILYNINNHFLQAFDLGGGSYTVKANLSDFVMATNAFYGESSYGTWSIKVIDGLSNDNGLPIDTTTQTGTFDDWSINIIGR